MELYGLLAGLGESDALLSRRDVYDAIDSLAENSDIEPPMYGLGDEVWLSPSATGIVIERVATYRYRLEDRGDLWYRETDARPMSEAAALNAKYGGDRSAAADQEPQQ
jgi:hypothetical protein